MLKLDKLILSMLLFLAIQPGCLLAKDAAVPVATVTHLGGTLNVIHADGSQKILSVLSDILEGDVLKTSKNTYARIRFIDNAEVVLRPETTFEVNEYRFGGKGSVVNNDKMVFSLKTGGIRAVTGEIGKRDPSKVQYKTVTAMLGVRGTHFGAILCNNDCFDPVTKELLPNGLYTDTKSGAIVLTNEFGQGVFPAGTFSFTQAGAAPILIPVERAVIVTIPANICTNKAKRPWAGSNGANNSCSVSQ